MAADRRRLLRRLPFHTTRFILLPSDKGNLLVIDNPEGQRIVQEVESRRAQQLLRQYDFLDPDESPEQRRRRFTWLHREGALSEDELRQRLVDIEPPKPPGEPFGSEPGRVLN